MTTTSPTQVDDDLYASAKAVGAIMGRSAAQQIGHWARIGRELEASATISHRDIADVLEGARAYDDIGAREQAVIRAQWAERVAIRIAGLDLSRDFTAEGRSHVELDDTGVVTRVEAPQHS